MIYVTAREREAAAQATEPITSGSVGMNVSFSFSESWDGLAKVAVFRGSGQSIDVALTGSSCKVPHEVLQSAGGHLKIGVYGTGDEGQKVTPTVWGDAGPIVEGAEPSEIEPTPATESLVQQLLAAAQAARDLAQSVRDDADAGEFDGQDGASAYEIAVEHGYEGTEAEWLESLKGADAVVDATLSVAGEAADAAETGKVKELADAVAERIYDYSTAIDDADITVLRGKNINSSNNLVDNENYSVLYLTAPAAGRYRVVSTSNSQLALRVYSSSSMSSATFVKTGIPGYTGYTRYVELEAGQVLAVRAKSNTFTISASYATVYTVEMRQDLPLTDTMEAQVKTMLKFPDDLEFPISAAHRGLASAGKVQNTMPAYEDAVAKGWRYLETDIRKTSDNVWVLLHDATIAAGVNIADITYAQALTYDLGGGTHIATLEELLILCRRAHAYPIIEIKDSSIGQADADAVWALVEQYEMEHCVFWLCSSVGGVSKFLAKDPYAPAICTSGTSWSYVDPSTFDQYSPYFLGYKTGKNKVFYARLYSSFSTKSDMDNFVDFCEYFGVFAGVYGPTTQAGIDGLSDRLSLVTSEVYKYEIERADAGGGGVTVDDEISGSSTNPVQNKVIAAALDAKGTYSKPSGGIPKTDLVSAVQTSLGKADTAYQKPSGGIQKTDLASDVQTSLGKADTALQEHQSLADYRTAADQDVIDAGKADKVTEVTVATDGAVTQALDAGKVYHFTGSLTALTLTLNSPAAGQQAQHHFDFVSGSTAPTVTIPASVTMPAGFQVEANTRYEIDILDGYGVAQSWEVTA